jgi:hypothetical protein
MRLSFFRGRTFGQKANPVFQGGEDFHLNACVGLNGGLPDFERMGSGFLEVAKRLAESLCQDSFGVDTMVWLHYGLGTTTSQVVDVLNGHLQVRLGLRLHAIQNGSPGRRELHPLQKSRKTTAPLLGPTSHLVDHVRQREPLQVQPQRFQHARHDRLPPAPAALPTLPGPHDRGPGARGANRLWPQDHRGHRLIA